MSLIRGSDSLFTRFRGVLFIYSFIFMFSAQYRDIYVQDQLENFFFATFMPFGGLIRAFIFI